MMPAVFVGLGRLSGALGNHSHKSNWGHSPISDSQSDPNGSSNLPPSLHRAMQQGKPETNTHSATLHWNPGTSGNARVASSEDPGSRKVRKAAQEFESQLISSWWQSMKDSGLPGGEDVLDPGSDTLNNLASQAMSSVIAAQGGLGLSNFMVSHLQQHSAASAGATHPATNPAGQP